MAGEGGGNRQKKKNRINKNKPSIKTEVRHIEKRQATRWSINGFFVFCVLLVLYSLLAFGADKLSNNYCHPLPITEQDSINYCFPFTTPFAPHILSFLLFPLLVCFLRYYSSSFRAKFLGHSGADFQRLESFRLQSGGRRFCPFFFFIKLFSCLFISCAAKSDAVIGGYNSQLISSFIKANTNIIAVTNYLFCFNHKMTSLPTKLVEITFVYIN